METSQLIDKLNQRQTQLKQMAQKLSSLISRSSHKTDTIFQLQYKISYLQKKLLRRQQQLEALLIQKQQLFDKMILLESQQNPESPQQSQQDPIQNFYIQLQNYREQTPKASFALSDFSPPNSQVDSDREERSQSIISNDIDITQELAKLGLSDLMKKIN